MDIPRALILLLLVPVLCLAQVGPYGRWTYLATVDLESKNPGAGVVYRFWAGSAFAEIYYYDMGQAWPEGVTSGQFNEMVVLAGNELRMAEKAGIFAELELGTSGTVAIAGHTFHLQRLTFRRGETQFTLLMYLSGIKGKLIKFIVTAPDGVAGNLEEDAAALIEAAFKKQTAFEAPWMKATQSPAAQ